MLWLDSTEKCVFFVMSQETEFETDAVRIEQDCTVSGSWCEIDAVLMKGTTFCLGEKMIAMNAAKNRGGSCLGPGAFRVYRT